MSPTLSGHHAIVVGGGSGIGLGTARLLARDGARVTIAGRTEQRLRDASAALAGEDLAVDWVRCDVMNGDDVRAAVEQASNGGELHIAVNVPGGGKEVAC